MKKIIPGYFMPIWQEIMLSRRVYAVALLSKLTLIPEKVMHKNMYFYRRKEDFIENFVNRMTDIYVYFDYKYCIISISKEFYKRLVLESDNCLDDLDVNKSNNKLLNICISFEEYDEMITKSWKIGANIDYLFLNIGIRYLKKLPFKRNWSYLEKWLYPLVVEDFKKLQDVDNFGITPIVECYNKCDYYLDWYRTYKDYSHYNYLVNKLISV